MNMCIDKKKPERNQQRTFPPTQSHTTLRAGCWTPLGQATFGEVLFGLRSFRYPNNQYSFSQYNVQSEDNSLWQNFTEQFAILCQDLIRRIRNSLFPLQHTSREPGAFFFSFSHQYKQRLLCICDSASAHTDIHQLLYPNAFSEGKTAKNGLCPIYQVCP